MSGLDDLETPSLLNRHAPGSGSVLLSGGRPAGGARGGRRGRKSRLHRQSSESTQGRRSVAGTRYRVAGRLGGDGLRRWPGAAGRGYGAAVSGRLDRPGSGRDHPDCAGRGRDAEHPRTADAGAPRSGPHAASARSRRLGAGPVDAGGQSQRLVDGAGGRRRSCSRPDPVDAWSTALATLGIDPGALPSWTAGDGASN